MPLALVVLASSASWALKLDENEIGVVHVEQSLSVSRIFIM